MAEGHIDVVPEIYPQIDAWLPRGVTIVSASVYGGAMRLQISGDKIADGKGYQLVVTEEPMQRIIRLVENPNQGNP